MSTIKLDEESHLTLEYGPYPRSTRVRVLVESDIDVSAYAVETSDLEEFEQTGDVSEAFDFKEEGQFQRLRFTIPPQTIWYLLIVNSGEDEVAAVHYNVQTLRRGLAR